MWVQSKDQQQNVFAFWINYSEQHLSKSISLILVTCRMLSKNVRESLEIEYLRYTFELNLLWVNSIFKRLLGWWKKASWKNFKLAMLALSILCHLKKGRRKWKRSRKVSVWLKFKNRNQIRRKKLKRFKLNKKRNNKLKLK